MKVYQQRIKRLVDLVAAGFLLVVLSPVMGLVFIAIKLDDGESAVFRQFRLGIRGKPFPILKFRTMVPNADQFLSSEGEATVNRITRVGRFLRMTSLDELPQLLNIFRGEMSFIGPRPALVDHWNRYTDEQRRRTAVRPGISGLAQVRGRSHIPWSQRIIYDLEYIDHFSIWLDIKILLKTIKIVILRESISIDRNTGFADDLGPPRKN